MRALIVARSVSAAEAVRQTLRYAPGFRVVGWVDVRRPCPAGLAEAQPDVVLVDAELFDAAIAHAREIRSELPDAKIVLLSDPLDCDRLNGAAAAGIDAVVAKSVSSASLGVLVREVVAGNIFHFAPPEASAEARAEGAVAGLTARELEILRHVAAGRPNSRIAESLWVTEQTVKFHLSNVYRKLGLANRTEAAHYAYTHGLAGAPPSLATPAIRVAA